MKRCPEFECSNYSKFSVLCQKCEVEAETQCSATNVPFGQCKVCKFSEPCTNHTKEVVKGVYKDWLL